MGFASSVPSHERELAAATGAGRSKGVIALAKSARAITAKIILVVLSLGAWQE
jgi:hypothetical protein